MKILLIDDNKEIQQLTSIILQHAGLKLDIAQDGAEALAKLPIQQYDSILLDLLLPGLSGFEIVEILKKNPMTKNIPIIAFTAHPIKDAQKELFDRGFDFYQPKPFRAIELVETVKSVALLPV